MKAIVAASGKKYTHLDWQEVPDVSFADDEVLVDVKATAVNRADLLQARGLYPPPPGESDILGLEMAGVIGGVGASVKTWKQGDRVCSLLPGGGYAEQAVVHKDMLMKLPAGWSFAEGAAVPEVWLTAYVNLFLEGKLKPGETVLIHAGGSGVGTAAIQLAREAGSAVFTTAGSASKLSRCKELGAGGTVNYSEQDFLEEILRMTGGKGVDLILDPVVGDYLERNLKLLKENGRLVIIGVMGGSSVSLDAGAVLMKSIRIIGSRLRSRPLSEKIEITRAFTSRFWPAFESGRLMPVIDRSFPIHEAEKAHAHVRGNRNIGKVILEVLAGV